MNRLLAVHCCLNNQQGVRLYDMGDGKVHLYPVVLVRHRRLDGECARLALSHGLHGYEC